MIWFIAVNPLSKEASENNRDTLSSDFFAFLTQLLMTYALQKAPASIVSPFNYTGIVWAIIFDYIIWNAHPMFATIFGGIIITISGIYIFKREAKIKSIK